MIASESVSISIVRIAAVPCCGRIGSWNGGPSSFTEVMRTGCSGTSKQVRNWQFSSSTASVSSSVPRGTMCGTVTAACFGSNAMPTTVIEGTGCT